MSGRNTGLASVVWLLAATASAAEPKAVYTLPAPPANAGALPQPMPAHHFPPPPPTATATTTTGATASYWVEDTPGKPGELQVLGTAGESVVGGCATCGGRGCGLGGCGGGVAGFRDCLRQPATVPPPQGDTVRNIFAVQRMNALNEYFVLYTEDWMPDQQAVLNPTGVRHLEGILRRLTQAAGPVKVEPTGVADLDERRKMAVVEALSRAGVPATDAVNRVVIGGTRAEGLRGADIQVIAYPNLGRRGGIGFGPYTGLSGVGGFGGYAGFGGYGGYGGIR